jgi:DNA topoisomerase-1
MAKTKTTASGGTSLVIVESPAKARTIGKFLGRGYTIEASIGHIRDLPQGAKEIPPEFKGQDWAYLGVNVHKDFDPVYVIPREKIAQVRKLKALLKNAKDLWLATDEDREGEAISWHLCEVLRPRVPVRRLVFHEITSEAIHEALEHPREIDIDLVRAQEVRRIVDRLYGYDVSPLLWRKIRPRLSAGRVQSVAVRLIVERERQRMAFVSATYWDLLGTFAKAQGEEFEAVLVSVDGRAVPDSRDFDPATGQLKDSGLLLLDERQAAELAGRIGRSQCRVGGLEDKPYTTRPYPPFTTSTLQQEANRKYGFTARHTMQAAQSLYENGHITYMRTDSTNLAAVAIETARHLVASQYGPEYLPERPRYYQTKVKNAQEAHEAIRPAGHPFDFPDALRSRLSPDQFKIYDLVWKRTVASQMADARGRRITISVEAGGAVFQASGRTIDFPGYLRAYVEGTDDPEARLSDRDVVLPGVAVGELLDCRGLEPKSHTTQPPNRYSEAALTRALEEMGIGRPSTYAQIIDTILARDYVFKSKRGNVLVPTWTAFAVSKLLEAHLPDLVDYQFTAEMEDELDAISRGELSHLEYLTHFYFGNDHPGLKEQLKNKADEIDARQVSRIFVGQPPGQAEIYIRVGRYGPFLEQGERRASLPDKMPPDELTLPVALEMLDKAAQAEQPLGTCPQTGRPIFLKVGRYGPYVQRGAAEGEEKPQNASLLKGMDPQDVTVEVAVKLLELPRTLGANPADGQPVVTCNGRYGAYVKCGEETRSLPENLSPLDVTLQQALDLLAQPKLRRGGTARKEPIRVFEPSPITGKAVQLLAGRYGPYVTDGATNASLPRGTTVEEVTLEYALNLLKARAERGPSRRPTRQRSGARTAAAATPKKTPKKAAKRPVKKKATRKKTAKKKAPAAKRRAAKPEPSPQESPSVQE